jgi:N-acetyl-alpha-D-muramate 1-phosphate uridylyltransferase
MASSMPKAAMVFAAGLGVRMRPLTDSLPKPLIKVAGKPLIDHCLDRFAEAGVERAVVNVHWLADQIEAHLAGRARPQIIFSDERAQLLDQGGGVRRALPMLGRAPFFLCNTDAFWIEGPRSNLARLAASFDPERMDAALLIAAAAGAVGVDWPGDFACDADGRLTPREDRHIAPFVYAGVAIIKSELFTGRQPDVFRLAPLLFEAARKGRLFGLRLDGLWLHVGRPESIAEAERAIDRSTL